VEFRLSIAGQKKMIFESWKSLMRRCQEGIGHELAFSDAFRQVTYKFDSDPFPIDLGKVVSLKPRTQPTHRSQPEPR